MVLAGDLNAKIGTRDGLPEELWHLVPVDAENSRRDDQGTELIETMEIGSVV